MKKKLVLWGTDAQDEKILVALQLNAEENNVDIWTFKQTAIDDAFADQMMKNWRNDEEVTFPEHTSHIQTPLSVADSLLPEDIKVERTDIIQRAQTEWHFIVLSSKLNKSYQGELSTLRDRVQKLESYDKGIWEELKGFWGKVQSQVQERNLFREHADDLRNHTNELFAKMKELRAALDAEFKEKAKENYEKFMKFLDEVEAEIEEGTRLNLVFDKLKDLQRRFKNTKFTKELRAQVWDRLDGAFKTTKEKKYGKRATNYDSSPLSRLQRRYDGLLNAIEKMERSIQRDKKDLEFEHRRMERTDGQLEAQIRQAKVNMIQSRIDSKGEKMTEMNKTKAELEEKMARQKERDAKQAERQKVEEAKKAAAEKIKAESKAAIADADTEKLEKAAEAIKETQNKKQAGADEAMATAAGGVKDAAEGVKSTLSKMVDKVKDVASEVIEEIKEEVAEVVEEAKEEFKEAKADLKEKVAEVKEEYKEEIAEAKEKFEEVKEKAKSVKSELKEKVSEVKAEIEEEYKEEIAEAKEKFAEVKEKAKSVTEELKGKVTEAKEEIADVKDETDIDNGEQKA